MSSLSWECPSPLPTPCILGSLESKALEPPHPLGGALTMLPGNVPNYPPFGPTPVVETFQPEEAACFGKFQRGAATARPPGSHDFLSLGASRAQCFASLAPPQLAAWALPSLPHHTFLPLNLAPQALLLQVGKLRPPRTPPCEPCQREIGVPSGCYCSGSGKERQPGREECLALGVQVLAQSSASVFPVVSRPQGHPPS